MKMEKKLETLKLIWLFLECRSNIDIPQNTYKIEIHLYDVKIWQTIYSNKMSNEK